MRAQSAFSGKRLLRPAKGMLRVRQAFAFGKRGIFPLSLMGMPLRVLSNKKLASGPDGVLLR